MLNQDGHDSSPVSSSSSSVFSSSVFTWPPVGAPMMLQRDQEDHLGRFDNSVSAVSFGFVATAILISMFLVMAIFERFLRPGCGGQRTGDLEYQMGFNSKLRHPSPKMTVYANGVSVLMPGDNIPTFIAHPAPVPTFAPQLQPPPPMPPPPPPPHQHESSEEEPRLLSQGN
ncbi:unnamed protein product [Linum tenue]|uniref:Uncharacterized protein n=1 Tax=Linum tenue TaxID=586396 RepID=A0AAV0JBQ1_9ROSI|nr:unnamed protein product [Linum tenue]